MGSDAIERNHMKTERKVTYIDVGSMSKKDAEKILEEIRSKYFTPRPRPIEPK